MSAQRPLSSGSGRFVPEIWSAKLMKAFAQGMGYMYGDVDPMNALRDYMEDGDKQKVREWFGRHARWFQEFAWLPKKLDTGWTWMQPYMHAYYVHRGGDTVALNVSMVTYVTMKLDDKIGPGPSSQPTRRVVAKKVAKK